MNLQREKRVGFLLWLWRWWRQRRANQRAKITQRQRCRKPLELQERATWREGTNWDPMARGGGCCCAGVETEANTDQFTGRKLCRGGEKKKTDLRADLGPFFSAQSNLSSRRGRGRGWKEGKKGREKKNKNKHCFPVSGPDGTQRGAGVKELLSSRHREEDD